VQMSFDTVVKGQVLQEPTEQKVTDIDWQAMLASKT
jgi:hypothetical protein